VLTIYNDEECRCKPEKVAISEEIYLAIPEPVDQVVVRPNEEIVPTPGEGASPAVPLPPAGMEIPTLVPTPAPEPVVATEPTSKPSTRRFLHGQRCIVILYVSPGQSWCRNTPARARGRCASFS
jgi:hypothetical protein